MSECRGPRTGTDVDCARSRVVQVDGDGFGHGDGGDCEGGDARRVVPLLAGVQVADAHVRIADCGSEESVNESS